MIQIIPAIDIIDGKCVRLSQGDFSRRVVYSDDPLDVAKRFEDAGLDRLHIVDLDGAKTGNAAKYGRDH
jgi:phosphoribosylformimino-5-aminoimidazole carboxamide ribotide isomerase